MGTHAVVAMAVEVALLKLGEQVVAARMVLSVHASTDGPDAPKRPAREKGEERLCWNRPSAHQDVEFLFGPVRRARHGALHTVDSRA